MKFVADTADAGRGNFNRGSPRIRPRDIAIRHESGREQRRKLSRAIFGAVSRGIKDATVNLGGSSFRWRNTIVRRCRWPEVRSKGAPRSSARPFYCDTIYDCLDRLPSSLFLFHSASLVYESLEFTYVAPLRADDPKRESPSAATKFAFAFSSCCSTLT